MVSVRKCFINDFPCLFLFKVFLIDQNSEKLDTTQCRMGVVELDAGLFGETFPGKTSACFLRVSLVPSQDVLNGG